MNGKRAWMIFFIAGMSIFLGTRLCQAGSDYPNRYIEIIYPYAPGGATDVINRCFKDKVEKVLGQPFVPLYKVGAAGMAGSLYVKGCKPDGYTLLSISPKIRSHQPGRLGAGMILR